MPNVRYSRFFSDILECPIATVVEESVAAASGGDEQVLVAIVIVVGKRRGNRDTAIDSDACFCRHIFECSVALVSVECVRTALVREVDVVATIIVEVPDRQAGSMVVEIDPASLRALLVGQVVHLEFDPSPFPALYESAGSILRSANDDAVHGQQDHRGYRYGREQLDARDFSGTGNERHLAPNIAAGPDPVEAAFGERRD